MVLPNPVYIDQDARHDAGILRSWAYMSVKGQQGVLDETDLAVTELDTPGAAIVVAPGLYAITNTATGAVRESYIGKVPVAEQVNVSATDSSGPRTDLVILRIENPYAVGTGSWSIPADAELGPYAHVRVIEDVATNINSVVAHNDTWAAIPLARIKRNASTGIVEQEHITDLRSLVDLSGERIIIIEDPPEEAPPIAQELWTESTHCTLGDELNPADTSFIDWPAQATYQVPIPSWARGVDVMGIFNPATATHAWAEVRLNVGGTTGVPTMIDENRAPDTLGHVYQPVLHLGGTIALGSSLRGKVVTVKAQARSLGGADLNTKNGVYFTLLLNFKRYPSFD